jgi:virginiamycin B lyase
MNVLWRAIGLIFLFASLSYGATSGTIAGTMKGPDGGVFQGAFVRAQNQKTKITVIVLSDKEGKYRIQDLAEGEYEVRGTRVGYKSEPHRVTVNAAQSVVLDFALQRALVRWSELSNYEGKVLLPDAPAKTVFFAQCVSCHGLQHKIAENAFRFNAEEWRTFIALMRDPHDGAGDGRVTDQVAAVLVPYLTKIFGVNSDFARSPTDLPGYRDAIESNNSPSYEGTNITYVDYELPGPDRIPWEATPNSNPKRNVWFVESWSANHIAELNKDTGQITEYAVPPDPNKKWLHVHSVVQGPDGKVWFAEGRVCQLNEFDPMTKKFSKYVPPSCAKAKSNGDEGGYGPSEVRVDRFGNVWANGGNLWRFDPRTKKFTEFPEGGSAYGFVLDEKEGNVWFAQVEPGEIGEVDIRTLKLRRWTPPATIMLARINRDKPYDAGNWNYQTYPRSAGTRRITSDSKGMIWFGEWFAGQIGCFDPQTETFKEFALPGPDPTPYGIGVDRNDFVWYASYDTDMLGRLNPATGKVAVYPLPYPGNEIREILRDPDGRMWFGTSFNNKVGYFIPPEGK